MHTLLLVSFFYSDSLIFSHTPAEDSTIKELMTFREAWDHPDEQQKEKWQAAIRKELKDMTNRGVLKGKTKQNAQWKEMHKTQMGIKSEKEWYLSSKIGGLWI